MLVVEQLVKRFRGGSRGEVRAVDGLSFTVSAGEVYGLLGPNGAGKTTTLRILSTLMEPDSGKVIVDGVDRLRDPLGARRKLAYVPAEAGLPDRLSPREVVRLFAQVQGVPHARKAAEAWLEKLGAKTYLDAPCADLSTGMKRRVVLARALVHEPALLLLDEPTDGLDVAGRFEVLDVVRLLSEDKRAIVISSHIMSEVEQVAHRIGVMRDGRLAAEGTLAEILQVAGTKSLDAAFLALTGARAVPASA